MSVTIRPLEAADRAAWDILYKGYADFYGVTQTAEMRDTVFGWLMDTDPSSNGLVAVQNGRSIIGLTHYRPFVSCLGANVSGFLDDLFVTPDARGSGAAQMLIDGVKAVAADNGWAKVRWITADDNYRARSLYDKGATRTMWVTYDLPV